jgi:hypothetical protein
VSRPRVRVLPEVPVRGAPVPKCASAHYQVVRIWRARCGLAPAPIQAEAAGDKPHRCSVGMEQDFGPSVARRGK